MQSEVAVSMVKLVPICSLMIFVVLISVLNAGPRSLIMLSNILMVTDSSARRGSGSERLLVLYLLRKSMKWSVVGPVRPAVMRRSCFASTRSAPGPSDNSAARFVRIVT